MNGRWRPRLFEPGTPENPGTPGVERAWRCRKRSCSRIVAHPGLLLAGLLLVSAPALSTPHPHCPGHCSDSPASACGDASDCADSCVFEDACIPGGAFAIARAIPEDIAGLNDFAAWQPVGVANVSVVDGALTLRPDAAYYSQCVGRTIPIEPGKRYALRARIRHEPGGWGYLYAAGTQTGRQSYAPAPTELDTWITTALPFGNLGDTPDTTLEVYLCAIHDGDGGVQVRDLALLELHADFGVHLRFTLEEPAIDATVHSPYVILLGGSAFYDQLDRVPIPAGAASEWLDVSSRFAANIASLGLLLEDTSGVRLTDARIRLDVAHRPDEAAIVREHVVDTTVGAVGFFVPGGTPNPLDFANTLGLISDLVQEDPERFRALPDYTPSPQPQRFVSLSGTGWIDAWGDWDGIRPVYAFFRELGFNGVTDQALPDEHAHWPDEEGLLFRYVNIGLAPEFLYPGAPYDLAALDAAMPVYFESYPHLQQVFDSYRERPEWLLLDMTDEANGISFAGPAYDDAFREYLRTAVLDCPAGGECPLADFGLQSWDDAHALQNMDGTQIDALRPDPADAAAARLFYWQVRFWSEATARVYARAAAYYLDHFESGTPIVAPQLGTPFGGYMSWRAGIEMQTVARSGAMTGFAGEAFLSYNDWCMGQHTSTYADWVAGHLDPHGLDRRESYIHPNRGSGPHKALALAARGITMVHHYTYGPHQLTTGDGMAGLGPYSVAAIRQMQDVSRVLAQVEGALADARRMTGPVAIMAAQSDTLWWSADTDYTARTSALSADEIGLHLALTHGHYPVRFLVEELLPAALGPDTEVLFVHRRHVSDAAFTAIRSWVEDGGTLLLLGEAGSHDEYGAFAPERIEWLGVQLGETDLILDAVYAVDWPGHGTIDSGRPRRVLTPGPDATTLATYTDGGVAAAEVIRGAGRIRLIGFELGTSYLDLADACLNAALPGNRGRFPTSYRANVREALLEPLADLADTRPAWADEPLVEVIALERSDGGAVALLNYTDAPLDAVTLTVPGAPAQARAVRRDQPVMFTNGALTLPLHDVEVITWSTETVEPGVGDVTEDAPESELDAAVDDPRPDSAADPDARAPSSREGCHCGAAASADGPALLAWGLILLALGRRRLGSKR